MTNPSDPAFPVPRVDIDCLPPSCLGLTKREVLAAIAMNGILAANARCMPEVNDVNVDYVVAREAVASADALIAELGKESTK